MVKKTFVRAKLSTGKRWTIDFQVLNPSSGQIRRYRKDFDLNEIQNLDIRREVGNRICNFLEHFSFFDSEPAAAEPAGTVTLLDAITEAVTVKLSSERTNTHRGYKYVTKKFLNWAGKLQSAPVSETTRRHAQTYFDTLKAGKLCGTTVNNHLIHLRALWSEMVGRGLVGENIFKGIKPARKSEKRRRIFTDVERVAVARWIKDNDYWLFRALLLQYYCFIRPVEIGRLKFKAFDLAAGTVTVEAVEAKKWKKRVATIPAAVLPYFVDGVFDKQPINYFVIGIVQTGRNQYELKPSTKPASEQRQYLRHRRALKAVKKSGEIADISGLTWYSWKDTGITNHTRKTTPIATRDQAGHADFDMTMIYYHPGNVNQEYKGLPDNLLKK